MQLSLLDQPARPAAKTAEPGVVFDAPPRIPRTTLPTIRGQVRVEQTLRRLIGPKVVVFLTANRSTMISFRTRGRVLFVRAHAMFAEAPDEVLAALAAFVTDKHDRVQAKLLDDWIAHHRTELTLSRLGKLRLQPIGQVHDLGEIYDRLNAEYFGGRVDARITWTTAAQKKRRRTIHMGTYSDDLRLIRIHPALDQEFVPVCFVEFVVFHEMLHQIHGVSEKGCGRRSIHPPAFRRDEKSFKKYREARAWEKKNLNRLLRY